MSLRTKANKAKQKALRGETKDKAWKNYLQPLYTFRLDTSRAGITYDNRVKNPLLHPTSRPNPAGSLFHSYLKQIPILGALFA